MSSLLLVMVALVSTWLAHDARREKHARRAWERSIERRLGGLATDPTEHAAAAASNEPEPAARVALLPASLDRVASAAPASQRRAQVPVEPSGSAPRTELPPASAEARARAARAAAPAEVARDERRTVEVPVGEVTDQEEQLRRVLRSSPFPDGTTLAQSLREMFHSIVDENSYADARHCEGSRCFPGAWGVCACPCWTCKVRRCALTFAQLLLKTHLPFVQLPGEKPVVWEMRRAHEEGAREPARAAASSRRCPAVNVAPSHPAALMSSALASNLEHRIDARFWAILDRAIQSRVEVAHCKGPECNPSLPTCSCECEPCGRRRAYREQAETEIMAPTGEAAERARERSRTIGARVEQRWHRLQMAADVDGKPAFHCEKGACGGEGATVCECTCEGCVRALDLLVQAEREVLGGEG